MRLLIVFSIFILIRLQLVKCKEYIVKLKEESNVQEFKINKQENIINKYYIFGKFNGFLINSNDNDIDNIIKQDIVEEVIENVEIDIFKESKICIQEDSPRHLARISRRERLPRGNKGLEYYYDIDGQGEGVNVYIIDTGIEINNNEEEFQDRVKLIKDISGEGNGDLNGHGTHVAGIIGSKTYGISKKAKMFDIKIMNKEGKSKLSELFESIEIAVEHCLHTDNDNTDKNIDGCIINLSLGTFAIPMLDSIIDEISITNNNKILFIVAAGNSGIDACWISPARSHYAITVGAFDDKNDKLAKFSNWGSCVDIFAPGVMITSLGIDGNTKRLSGTSMSTPIISGLAANLLSRGMPASEVSAWLAHTATQNVFGVAQLALKPETPDRVVFNGVQNDNHRLHGDALPLHQGKHRRRVIRPALHPRSEKLIQ